MKKNNSQDEAAKQRGNSAGALAKNKATDISKINFREVLANGDSLIKQSGIALFSISSISGDGSLERFNQQS